MELQPTPREKNLLSLPNIQYLITKFDCIYIPSLTTKTNTAIHTRIETWITEFTTAPELRPQPPPQKPYTSTDSYRGWKTLTTFPKIQTPF